MIDNRKLDSLLLSAKEYKDASYILNNSGLIIPSHINAAFSLELYFKSLYYIEYKQESSFTHNFYSIYKKLSNNTKKNLLYNYKIDDNDTLEIKSLEKKSGVKIKLDFESQLIYWSEIFVKLRYLHDNKNKSRVMVLFPNVVDSLITVINSKLSNI